jgi:hypothetical protein
VRHHRRTQNRAERLCVKRSTGLYERKREGIRYGDEDDEERGGNNAADLDVIAGLEHEPAVGKLHAGGEYVGEGGDGQYAGSTGGQHARQDVGTWDNASQVRGAAQAGLLTNGFAQRATHNFHHHWHHGDGRHSVRHEVGEDEDGNHEHGQQREGRCIRPHRPNNGIPDFMQQTTVSDRTTERAAAAQQQQHVPVQRPKVSDVEDASAVQNLRFI